MSFPDNPHAPAFQALCAEVVPVWSRHLATAQHQSEAGVGSLLQSFAQLRQLLVPSGAQADAARISELLEDILIHLQFQDRTSQMMALLQEDMERLTQAALNPNGTSLDAPTWMARLQAGYAMQEQHSNHASPDADLNASGGETTYF
jgi:methyl-accepting chemotaxis protein